MSRKILIVDDEPDMRSLLKRALISNNYNVEETENLQAGFELFKQIRPDIVMLDVNLPDGNGTEHIDRFRGANTIILLMSADNDHLQATFHELGVNGFIKKPFVLDELLSLINRHLIATNK